MFSLNLEKTEEPELKLPTSVGSSKKQDLQKKHLFLLYWLCQSLWLCGSQQVVEILKEMGYQTTLPASWKILMQVKKQQLELDMEQWSGSKLIKAYVKTVYCHAAYITYMQSTSWETLGWMKHKLESRYADDTTLMTESKEELNSLLMKVKKESEKVGLKLNI